MDDLDNLFLLNYQTFRDLNSLKKAILADLGCLFDFTNTATKKKFSKTILYRNDPERMSLSAITASFVGDNMGLLDRVGHIVDMFVDPVCRCSSSAHDLLWRHRYIDSDLHLRPQTLGTRSDGWFDTCAVSHRKATKQCPSESRCQNGPSVIGPCI
ncbi:hypothetical protein [Candidatus Phyllobacterium onerii]|uniref:hypothetical protein n=1 Tax=Candidatus Phyllobacterium onerii TaxID=3020828 RepID=UPI00233080F8|nr:hypothetical protein [Phyllobacterium sp. IY22]